MTATPAQRATGAALLFLAAAALAGVTPTDSGVEYRVFGVVEGVFGLLLTYVLLQRRAWKPLAGPVGWAALAYGTLASAQVAEFLFPPPGVLEWVVVATLALTGWGTLARGSRKQMVFGLATLAVLLGLLRYSIIPVLWGVGPRPGDVLGVGNLAEGARRVVADYRPIKPVGQLLGVAAIACWALATRLLWPALRRRPRDPARLRESAPAWNAEPVAEPVDIPIERGA
ncbi:MAG TPA: hypothetical protein VE913_08265 [Longimicrobium sp.]|nr:hypothetical protein [Longimicrobium sp.]